MAHRTFEVKNPHMSGGDVKQFQRDIKTQLKKLGIENSPLTVDGDYGAVTRSITACLCHALGMIAHEVMKDGVTPELRRRIRKHDLTEHERKRGNTPKIRAYRKRLNKRWHESKVAQPVDKILADSWGYHPGVHDGLDVICGPDVPIYAMVRSKVVDVRSSGWWGLGAPSNPALKAKGDGIIQIEVLDNVGPFKKGQHICYGHAEKAAVKVGDIVKAGQRLGHAGFANAWHIHLMVNDGRQGNRGVGTQDPRPLLDYAVKNG